jgi:hypothetical protein
VNSEADTVPDWQEVALMNLGYDVHPLRRDLFGDADLEIPIDLPAGTLFIPDNNPARYVVAVVFRDRDSLGDHAW